MSKPKSFVELLSKIQLIVFKIVKKITLMITTRIEINYFESALLSNKYLLLV